MSMQINWEKVAEDRGITSKGAAYVLSTTCLSYVVANILVLPSAKRYERLLKAHGITNPSQRGKDGDSTPQTPKKRGKVVDNGDEEDDEESPTKKTKGRKMSIKKEVKKEEDVNSD